MHKFKAINRTKLDNPKRREILPPKETLINLGLKSDDIVAGIGYFTFPAANIVNENNQVYALDISSEMLEDIKNDINENNVRNITCIKTEEGPPVEHRIAKEELLDLYKTCGFEFVDEMSFFNTFYGLVAKNI